MMFGGNRWTFSFHPNKITEYNPEARKIVKTYQSSLVQSKRINDGFIFDQILFDGDNMIVSLMDGYNPMIMGQNKEGGNAHLLLISIKKGKVTKVFEKIHTEPINCMCLNGDNLFTASNDGYLLNFSIKSTAIVHDYGFVCNTPIEALASHNKH